MAELMPINFPLPAENTIASFSFNEIASGEGYAVFYLDISQTSAKKSYLLSSNAIHIGGTSGYLISEYTFDFRTNNFNLPRTAKGTAYLAGWCDFNAHTVTGTAQLVRENFQNISKGSSVASDATEVNLPAGAGYNLVKTISAINTFVYEVTDECKKNVSGSAANVKIRFNYANGEYAEATPQSFSSGTYAPFTHTNPYNTLKVSSIGVYLERTGDTAYEKSTIVYGLTGVVSTNLTSSVVTPSMTADAGVNLAMPLTTTQIKQGDVITLYLTKTGATGGFVVDPSNAFVTDESMKLYLPFKIES